MMALAGQASATVHPIVEPFDYANEQTLAHRPYEDPAEVAGRTPRSPTTPNRARFTRSAWQTGIRSPITS
jgi:hypothetical protein